MADLNIHLLLFDNSIQCLLKTNTKILGFFDLFQQITS